MKPAVTFLGLLYCVALVGCGDARKPGTDAPAVSNSDKPEKVAGDTPAVDPSHGKSISTDTKPTPQVIPRIETPANDPPVESAQVKQWIASLSDASNESREQAEQALIAAGSGAIPALLAALSDKSPETRRALAYFLLEKFPSSDARVGAGLRDALGDEDRKVRQLALQAVKRMPPETMALAVPKIAGLLDPAREEPVNRADAARLLGRLGPEAREALPALTKAATSDTSEKVRAPALYSITKIAEPSKAVPLLVTALQSDKDAAVRLVAASGLGRLAPASAATAGDLAEAFADKDEKVRRAASDSLVALEAAALAPVVGKLDAPNPRERELAVYTLGRLGPLAKPATAALQKRLKDEDAAVRALAEAVLASLGEL